MVIAYIAQYPFVLLSLIELIRPTIEHSIGREKWIGSDLSSLCDVNNADIIFYRIFMRKKKKK